MQYRLNRRFFPWLIFHAIEFWHYYLGAIVCLALLHNFSSEIPILAKSLGDYAMQDKLGDVDIWQFFLLAIYILLFRTLSRLLFFYPARIQQRNLRVELVERIETSPPKNYKDYTDGMLFQTIFNDLNRIRGFVGFALLQLGNIIIAGFIFIPKIMSFNSDFLVAFSPLVLTVFLFSILVYFFQPFVRRSMDEYAEVQNIVIESYEAKKTIQNYHAEKDFRELFKKFSDQELRTFYISSMGRVFSFPMVKLGVGASLIWAALIVKDNGLAASDLIFFSTFLFLILEPLILLSWIGIVASQGYAAWVRIKELITSLDLPLEESWMNTQDIKSLNLPLWNNKINITLMPKRWNIFVGETGCGKSWCLEKIALFLSFKKINYSLIQQEPYLYNDTVQNNIFLGIDPTPEKLELVKDYLQKFSLTVLNDDLDSLLSMELGENGKRVSGGQAKRISLIRSLVADVDYILWDDPFSSIDLILESEILKEIKQDPRLNDKTFILTSHRLSTVRLSDYIFYIDKDKGLIESGEVSDLLENNSKVRDFFEKQNS